MYMSKIVLVAETGADLTPELVKRYGIYIVPMHVTMGDVTKDDGSFPTEEICDFYDRTGQLPKTSGSSPEDFARVFEEIHRVYPDKHILHLAYSAVTTVSYQNAKIAAEHMDFVTSVDTKHVSAGQTAVVVAMAQYLEEHPDTTPEEAVEVVHRLREKTHMCFVPDDLEYPRAGGRVSNVVCLGGRILNIHPCIDVVNGYLVGTKKYRGKLPKVVGNMVLEYSQINHLKRDHIWLLASPGFPDEARAAAEEAARQYGFKSMDWLKTGCVITTHGGPRAFGMAGMSE